MSVTNFKAVLELLAEHRVEFVLIGGLAATVHGYSKPTKDVDIVYKRSPENIEKLAGALAQIEPYLRGAPPGLPFKWDVRTIQRGLNFTLTTKLGAIDVLGEVAGGGTYDALVDRAKPISVFGAQCLCVDLTTLIHLKRAAGRGKDLAAIAELELLLELKDKRPEE